MTATVLDSRTKPAPWKQAPLLGDLHSRWAWVGPRIAAIPFVEGVGLPRGLSGSEGAPTLVEGTPSWVVTKMGTRALHLEGWEGISYRNLGITKNITFGAVFIPYGSLVDGGSLFGHYQYSAREDVASVDWGILSNGSVWRARVTVGGVSYIVSSTTAAAGQSRLALFGVREGDNLHIYVNGRLEGTTTGLGSGTLDTDFTLYLGADSGSAFTLATAGTNADFEMLYVCEHALPAPAIMELSRINPFALIRPARPSTSRFVPSAGFTTVLIKPASAAP